jgi:hypothetical protein
MQESGLDRLQIEAHCIYSAHANHTRQFPPPRPQGRTDADVEVAASPQDQPRKWGCSAAASSPPRVPRVPRGTQLVLLPLAPHGHKLAKLPRNFRPKILDRKMAGTAPDLEQTPCWFFRINLTHFYVNLTQKNLNYIFFYHMGKFLCCFLYYSPPRLCTFDTPMMSFFSN